jgi:hypothetical protein
MRIQHARTASLTAQRGVALFIALVALIMMSIAGLALMRSVDVGNSVVGNLALRQAALVAGDRAFQVGYNWLVTNKLSLGSTDLSNGYSATLPTFNDTDLYTNSAFWANAVVVRSPGSLIDSDALGYTVKYLMFRQSLATGTPSLATTMMSQSPSTGTGSATCAEGEDCTTGSTARPSLGGVSAYYSIFVMITGPRNTSTVLSAVVGIPTS